MQTKIIIAFIALCTFTLKAFSQKVKIKKDIAYVDGNPYLKVEKEAGNMSVYGLDGDDEIIYLKWYDPTPSNNRNLDDYYIVRFIDFDEEVEIEDKTRKGILKMLFKGKVVDSDGKLNEERMKKFISKYGSDASKNKLYLN